MKTYDFRTSLFMSRKKVGATGAPLTGLASNLIGTYANQQNSANSMDIMANQNTDPLTFNVMFPNTFYHLNGPKSRVRGLNTIRKLY